MNRTYSFHYKLPGTQTREGKWLLALVEYKMIDGTPEIQCVSVDDCPFNDYVEGMDLEERIKAACPDPGEPSEVIFP